jgi:hypothetical protein
MIDSDGSYRPRVLRTTDDSSLLRLYDRLRVAGVSTTSRAAREQTTRALERVTREMSRRGLRD